MTVKASELREATRLASLFLDIRWRVNSQRGAIRQLLAQNNLGDTLQVDRVVSQRVDFLRRTVVERLRKLGWKRAGAGTERVVWVNGRKKLAMKVGYPWANLVEWLWYQNLPTAELRDLFPQVHWLTRQRRVLVVEQVQSTYTGRKGPSVGPSARTALRSFNVRIPDDHEDNFGWRIGTGTSVVLDTGHVRGVLRKHRSGLTVHDKEAYSALNKLSYPEQFALVASHPELTTVGAKQVLGLWRELLGLPARAGRQ